MCRNWAEGEPRGNVEGRVDNCSVTMTTNAVHVHKYVNGLMICRNHLQQNIRFDEMEKFTVTNAGLAEYPKWIHIEMGDSFEVNILAASADEVFRISHLLRQNNIECH